MPTPATVTVVVGCVITQDDKILLVQEKLPKAYGKWNLPAGRVDTGESLEQAAIRETKEETGFDVMIDQHIFVIHPSIDRSVLHAFTARIVGGSLHIPTDEILDAKWFTRDEIDAMIDHLREPAYIMGAIKAAVK